MRLNILIQTEEIAGIIVRFDRDQAFPSPVVGFSNAVLLVAAHEIYVDARLHGRPQLFEE